MAGYYGSDDEAPSFTEALSSQPVCQHKDINISHIRDASQPVCQHKDININHIRHTSSSPDVEARTLS